jgi:hypothetical protein
MGGSLVLISALNGMTAATSEYAMLDSMFAMDPVFPGLGVEFDQALSSQLDDPYINPSWESEPLHFPPQMDVGNRYTSKSILGQPSLEAYTQSLQAGEGPGGGTWASWTNSTATHQDPRVEGPSSMSRGSMSANPGQLGAGASDSASTAIMPGERFIAEQGRKQISSSEVYRSVVKP